MSISDKVILDWSELKLKWAVEDVNKAVEKLINLLDERGEIEALETLSDYLDNLGAYYKLAYNEPNEV